MDAVILVARICWASRELHLVGSLGIEILLHSFYSWVILAFSFFNSWVFFTAFITAAFIVATFIVATFIYFLDLSSQVSSTAHISGTVPTESYDGFSSIQNGWQV